MSSASSAKAAPWRQLQTFAERFQRLESLTPILIFANKNSQSTTALNHCVDCNCLSSPAASPSVSWRAAEARFYSWRKLEREHKYFFIHTRASLAIRISLLELNAIVMGSVVMSIFLEDEFVADFSGVKGCSCYRDAGNRTHRTWCSLRY